MAQLRRPLVPDGPRAVFYARLHALHADAGWPSMRELQRLTRTERRPSGINPTTVHDAFSAPRLAKWEVVAAIVERLNGDVEEFAELWRAAHRAESDVTSGVVADRWAAPSELPPDVFGFVGRSEDLSQLDKLCAGAGSAASGAGSPVMISVLSGTAGVGKTALAIHWAHRVADRFPDGQLYVDLRGYDEAEPVAPEDAVAGFLRSLGLDGASIPYAGTERTARYRTLLAGRRMLIVLDNAMSAEQVRPLLPGSASCLVLVTSRDRLPALAARDGARRLELDRLAAPDAADLLRILVGERVERDPVGTDLLADRCARLPLALRIAAELAAARPEAGLSELAAELAGESRGLDRFDAGGDERTAVRAVFSWSYRRLPPATARAFRVLGVSSARDVDGYRAAALLDRGLDEARDQLDRLAQAHLVEPTGDQRYAMHDLLHAYAAERAGTEETDAELRAARDRLTSWYLYTAATAMDVLFPADGHRRPPVSRPATPVPHFDGHRDALAWLDRERDALVAVAVRAEAAEALRFAGVLWRYLHTGAHYLDAIAVHDASLLAARALGDRAGEGAALHLLGNIHWRWGRYDEALHHYGQALEIRRDIGDRPGEAGTLDNSGVVHRQRGDYRQALRHHEAALAVRREIGDRAGAAQTLDYLGMVYERTGRYQQAYDHHELALAEARSIGHRPGEGAALDNLGVASLRLGRAEEALEHHGRALVVAREVADRAGEADTLDHMGSAYQGLGRSDEALDHHRQAFELARRIGHRAGEAESLTNIGDVLLGRGSTDEARRSYQAALTAAREIGGHRVEVSALIGLGDCEPEDDRALTLYREALRVARSHGQPRSPEAQRARRAIAERG